jgi:hypothetical protein
MLQSAHTARARHMRVSLLVPVELVVVPIRIQRGVRNLNLNVKKKPHSIDTPPCVLARGISRKTAQKRWRCDVVPWRRGGDVERWKRCNQRGACAWDWKEVLRREERSWVRWVRVQKFIDKQNSGTPKRGGSTATRQRSNP